MSKVWVMWVLWVLCVRRRFGCRLHRGILFKKYLPKSLVFLVCFIYTQVGLGPKPPKQKSNIFHHSQGSRWEALESRKNGVSVTNLTSKRYSDLGIDSVFRRIDRTL